MRAIILESSFFHTKKSYSIFHCKDHELLTCVDPLVNVYLDNPMVAHNLSDTLVTTCTLTYKLSFHETSLIHIHFSS